MEHFGSVPGAGGAAGGFGDEIDDPELARAIEASYASQTDVGMGASEDELFAEALRISALEEEERKRRELGLSAEDEAMLIADGGDLPSGSSGAIGSAAAPRVPEANPSTDVFGGRLPSGGERSGHLDSAEDDFAAIAASGLLGQPSAAENSRGVRPGDISADGRGELLAPGGMDADAMAAAAVVEQAEMSDRQLAMAIEASYTAQTEHGRIDNEEDMMAQALRASKMEEETRERASLREQQESELQESMLMDQFREEEQKRRRTEEQQLERLETERLAEEAKKRDAEESQKKVEEEQKKARIPDEPPAGEPGRVDIMIKFPDGKRVRRAFRGTETVGQVYDYVDVECNEAVAGLAKYRLVTSMPRQAYEDKSLTLVDAGFKGQCALMIEAFS